MQVETIISFRKGKKILLLKPQGYGTIAKKVV